jgi:hypothetical protein
VAERAASASIPEGAFAGGEIVAVNNDRGAIGARHVSSRDLH